MLPIDCAFAVAKKYAVQEFRGTVIYSAAIGNRDYSPPCMYPSNVVDDVQFVFFSDSTSQNDNFWQHFLIDESDIKPVYLAKVFKVFSHVLFPNAKLTVWLDANLVLKSVSNVLQSIPVNSDLVLFNHPIRKTIKGEALACARLAKGEKKKLYSQVANYRRLGYPLGFGLFAGGFIIRRSNKTVEATMHDWWEEINKYTPRDQISLPYVVWKNEVRYTLVRGDLLKNDCVEWAPHGNPGKREPFLWRVIYSLSGRTVLMIDRVMAVFSNIQKR